MMKYRAISLAWASRTTSLLASSLALVICLGLGMSLVGCGGGSTADDRQRDAATEFTALEPTRSSCSIETIGAPAFGTILVEYLAIDFPASFVDMVPEYSLDGGITFFPATEGNGGDGDIVLSASEFGDTHFFAWDTLTDLPGSVAASLDNVVFRITTVEISQQSGPNFGTPCTSNQFSVLNTPAIIDLGSLSTGLAQPDQTIPIVLTNAVPSSNPTSVTVDVVYDSSLISITGAIPGPAAPGGSTITFMLISPGRVRVTVDSGGGPFPDGEIITLIADTACLAPRALPASAAILCSTPSATDMLGNAVAVTCGAAGATALIDNSSIMSFPGSVTLALGQPTEMVPLTYTNGVPSVNADTLTFTITYDPLVVDLVGLAPGPVLDPGATLTFTPGVGSATYVIANPPGVPFADGDLFFVLVDVTATMGTTSFLTIGNVQLGSTGLCPVVAGVLTSPVIQIDVTDQRSIQQLHAVDLLGSRGTPTLVAGSDVPGNPKGNWTPLNVGEFNDTISLQGGGNSVLFFSPADPPFQIVLEANWSAPPVNTDVAPAVNVDGTTTYMTLSTGAFVSIGADGLLTPIGSNGCDIFQATFTPNMTFAFGMPMSVNFAACVDLGGIDSLTRLGAGALPTGNLDADIPGLPLGDPVPGPGGAFTETVYLNTGATPVGAYQVQTDWNSARMSIDGAIGNNGYDASSLIALAGPTVVNIMNPGQSVANHFTVSMAFSGIFDIWTIHFNVSSSGTTNLDHTLQTLVSSAVPPAPIGAATPRFAPEASAMTITVP